MEQVADSRMQFRVAVSLQSCPVSQNRELDMVSSIFRLNRDSRNGTSLSRAHRSLRRLLLRGREDHRTVLVVCWTILTSGFGDVACKPRGGRMLQTSSDLMIARPRVIETNRLGGRWLVFSRSTLTVSQRVVGCRCAGTMIACPGDEKKVIVFSKLKQDATRRLLATR